MAGCELSANAPKFRLWPGPWGCSEVNVSTSEIFRVSALIDRLVGPGELFSATEASELITLVPLTKKPSAFQFKAVFQASDKQAAGLTSTGSSAPIESDEQKTFMVGHDQTVRVGRYVMRQQRGRLDIADFMQGPDESENNACRLTYEAPARPTKLLWYQPVLWNLGVFRVLVSAWKPWKTPA